MDDGAVCGKMDGYVGSGRTDEWMDAGMGQWIDEYMEGCVGERMNGYVKGWVGRVRDLQVQMLAHKYHPKLMGTYCGLEFG